MSEADINEAKRSIRARFLVRRDQFILDVDLRLPGQGVTAIFGPSGCGKTTLLRAIAGLDRWEGGEVSVGSSIWQDSSTFIPVHRRPIGYVFQEPRLFAHLTVRGNINYARQRAHARSGSISTDGIVEMLDISPLLDRQPAALSGGEKQRVAIARALATNPRLLLMDEPLASLDRERKREILPVLETLHRELDFPVFHVTHALDEVVRLADHVLLLQAGGTAGFGPVGDMLTRLDSSLAHGEDAGAMIEAVVREVDHDFGLAVLEFDGGQFLVPGTSLAPGAAVRLSVAARDVSLALSRSTDSSILNVFPATVTEMTPEGDAQMMVRLLVGGSPLLARVTRKSANALGLAPGLAVFAQVKSVAMQG